MGFVDRLRTFSIREMLPSAHAKGGREAAYHVAFVLTYVLNSVHLMNY